MKEEMVTITKRRYDELVDSEWRLVCLESLVYKCKKYDDALEEYWKGKEE